MPTDGILSPGLRALCRNMHADSPEAAIRSACLRLLERCGIHTPPVPLNPLLEALDVAFSWSRSGPHWQEGQSSASLQVREGRLAIFIHEEYAYHRWRRTRFSIAHELAHALLYRILDDSELSESLDKDNESHRYLERLCNLGAAEILMPTHMFRISLRENTLSPKGLLDLYDTFLVSENSLLWKVTSLLPETSVTRWRKHARNSDEKVEPRVISCYPPYRHWEVAPWLPSGATTKHINPDLVTSVIDHGEVCHSERLKVKLGRREWSCSAVATFFKNRKSRDLPLFRGLQVGDETTDFATRDALLFTQNETERFSLPWKSQS